MVPVASISRSRDLAELVVGDLAGHALGRLVDGGLGLRGVVVKHPARFGPTRVLDPAENLGWDSTKNYSL